MNVLLRPASPPAVVLKGTINDWVCDEQDLVKQIRALQAALAWLRREKARTKPQAKK